MQEKQQQDSIQVPCGYPIPLDEHACSVSLPKWSDVVGYEEGNVSVTSKMVCGYPRFVYHPYLVRLMEVAVSEEEDWDCIVLPSYDAACRAHDFICKAVAICRHTLLTSPDNALDATAATSNDMNKQQQQQLVRIKDLKIPSNVHAVIFPAETKFAIAAKSYWQHTGEIVTSRRAEAALIELGHGMPERVSSTLLSENACASTTQRTCESTKISYACRHPATITPQQTETSIQPRNGSWKGCPQTLLKQRIASITNTCADSNIFLFPSGMASIYSALRSSRRYRLMSSSLYGGGTSIVFGFPYLDTLKLCGRPEICPDGVEFFGNGNDRDLLRLEQMLEKRQNNSNNGDANICALITEFPSNPLLNCHDLIQLRKLADKYNFILIVDDTISNFANTDLISTGIADVVCTSLTKLMNGRGDAMGGSMVINPNTPKGQWMMKDMKTHHKCDLYSSDAIALYRNSEDFLERSTKINETSEMLADWFYTHPDLSRVYYPKFTQPELYNRFLNTSCIGHKPGYGGLISIILGSHMCQRTFYDSLGVYKGPSLGTNFTLVCPYTLLAHYHELEFVRAYNVSPNLIRIAVGLEEYDTLKTRFEKAFDISRLHPKLKPSTVETRNIQQQRGYCTVSLAGRQRCASASINTISWRKHQIRIMRKLLR